MTTTLAQVVKLVDSNKSKAAFFAPFITSMTGVLVSWAATGNFSITELRAAVAGLLLSMGTAAATYFTPAGAAEVEVDPGGVPVDDEDVLDGPAAA